MVSGDAALFQYGDDWADCLRKGDTHKVSLLKELEPSSSSMIAALQPFSLPALSNLQYYK